MRAVDFFCGGGGMTRGLLNAGIEVQFGIDCNPQCQLTYEYNNQIPYICSDISTVKPEELVDMFPLLADADELLLAGCAPCQPFSNQRRSEREHLAVNLLDEFARMVRFLNPAHVLLENVPGIQTRGRQVFDRFLTLLEEMGYGVAYRVINARDYGVPQNRKRLILIASRHFIPDIPPATHGNNLLPYVTIRDTIGHFPPIIAGESHNAILNHSSAALRQINIDRLEATPHDGGSRLDWPPDLALNCHQKGHTGHTDVYGRMFWDRTAPTLTSKCFSISNGRFAHPDQDRAISLREAASIQCFPENYEFFGSMQEIGRQIGNAVPVLLAEIIGEYILDRNNA